MTKDSSPPNRLRFPPVFATNNTKTPETVAQKIQLLIDGSLSGLATPPDMSIASAYINTGGFALIADQLENIPKVRLLLGAQPEAGIGRDEFQSYTSDPNWLKMVLQQHEEWLKAERDLTAFSRVNDASAKRMVAWLNRKDQEGNSRVEIRRYTEGFLHGKAFIIDHPTHSALLAGSSNFTFAGLSLNRELNLGYPNTGETYLVQQWFDDLWAESESYDLAALYQERWEPHSPWLIFMRMLHELYWDFEEDSSFDAGLNLTNFQRDGVARMLRLLDSHGGVLVADEVGLGKTFLAGEIIRRAVEQDRQKALIICPAAVKESVWDAFLLKFGYSRRAQVYSYDQLRLNYENEETGDEFRKELDDYALVVIDEAHNLRNPNTLRASAVNALLGGPHPKKVILLTATPVNNSLFDLYNLISYFIKNDGYFAGIGIPSIRGYIKAAHDLDPESLSPRHLFDLMDQVAVRRTRRFVKKNYVGDTIVLPSGRTDTIRFPTPKVSRLDYQLDDQGHTLLDRVLQAISVEEASDLAVRFSERHYIPGKLLLARYTASAYSRFGSLETYQIRNSGLLRSALLKRLESSPRALSRTLNTMISSHNAFLSGIEQGYVLAGDALNEWTSSGGEDLDSFLELLDIKAESQVQRIEDFHIEELIEDVQTDVGLLKELRDLADVVANSHDHKVDRLIKELREIASQSLRIDGSGLSESSRRKTVIFSSFTDTVSDIYEKISQAVSDADPNDPLFQFRGRIASAIYGAKGGTDQHQRSLEIGHFAPETAGKLADDGTPISDDRYDLLFTTDVLSEGVNLQQAGRMINYDLPWNPMRLVQRSGRIDRIGSKHQYIHIGCFFPADRLNDMLRLEEILMRKLAYADAAIGAGEVLPGQKSKTDVVLADTKEQILALANERPDLFESDGDVGALSGEEYRRRLAKTLEDSRYKKKVLNLPFGSGSGFVSGTATTNGYVFCIRMGNHQKPWFRFVPVDDNWNTITYLNASKKPEVAVEDDTLVSLINADPLNQSTERWLPHEVYDKAFDAWDVAASHAYTSWNFLTNPNNLMPEIERAFRDAAELVYQNGTHLGADEQASLAARLSGRWGNDIKKAVRAILTDDSMNDRDKVEKLGLLADEYGLGLPIPPQPLAQIGKDEVRLIAWMAISKQDRGRK